MQAAKRRLIPPPNILLYSVSAMKIKVKKIKKIGMLLALGLAMVGEVRSAELTPNPAIPSAPVFSLKIKLKGLKNAKGKVIVRLYLSKNGFPDEAKEAFKTVSLEITDPDLVTTVLSDLVPGTYAVSAIHDENASGEMDTNWIGIPREGLAVSRDAKGSFGPPSFKDAAFDLKEDMEIVAHFLYL